jgi:hypothetical protein
MQSLDDALVVAAEIERADIAGLEEAIAGTDAPELKRAYQNLLNASIRHLDAIETGACCAER